MKKQLQVVFKYFIQFKYAPTLDEIYTFFPKRIDKNTFLKKFSHLEKQKCIISISNNPKRYTLQEYGLDTRSINIKKKLSYFKIKSIAPYIRILSLFPNIEFIGLSGSIAMQNALLEDDIDLFIITRTHRLWTSRFIANSIAFFMGKKRSKYAHKASARDKVCLNMFIDSNSLKMPKYKQNKYIAHEILQLKPLVNKNQEYEKFILANKWIYAFYPNTPRYPIKKNDDSKRLIYPLYEIFGNGIEKILKAIQIFYMSSSITNESIMKGQLWFHPHDFENRIKF